MDDPAADSLANPPADPWRRTENGVDLGPSAPIPWSFGSAMAPGTQPPVAQLGAQPSGEAIEEAASEPSGLCGPVVFAESVPVDRIVMAASGASRMTVKRMGADARAIAFLVVAAIVVLVAVLALVK
jgi:hypothetical protein